MGFIGFGGWIYYYYFLIGSSVTKALKDDIFGFGKTFQIFNELIISRHKFMILFLNYFSEFFFGLIISLYLIYSEKFHIKRKNLYKKLESNSSNTIDDSLNKSREKDNKKKKNGEHELKIITKNNKKINEDKNETIQNTINNNLLEEDDISNLTSLIEKKSGEINGSNTTDDSQIIPKKYELIHNDLYEDITESSYKTIFLSSFLLIIYDIIMKWIFSSNDTFDYFFFNILIMTLILKYHYKEKIYSHQTLSLIIILFISGSLFGACLFEDVDFTSENKTIWEAFNERHYIVFIFIMLSLVSSTCYGYGTIIQKKIMDNKFVYPYKIIFWKGTLGMIISVILIIISTLVPCKENHIVNINTSKFLNSNNIYVTNFISTNNSNSSTPLFECVDSYNNNTYFDNFLSYIKELNNNTRNNVKSDSIKNKKYLEIFLYIPIYSILHFLTNILLIFVNKLLSPIHCLIVDSLYRIIHTFIQTLQNNDIQKDSEGLFYEFIIQPLSTKILRVLAYFTSLLGYSIYLEIIELKFCGLNKNIRKNIRKRAKLDGKERGNLSKTTESSSSFIGEDSEDSGSVKNKGNE